MRAEFSSSMLCEAGRVDDVTSPATTSATDVQRSTRFLLSPASSMSSAPPARVGTPAARRRAVVQICSHGYWVPCSYQLTNCVHSPASVGAMRSPTSALTSVDLPAFTRPAIATRSGPCRRATYGRCGVGVRRTGGGGLDVFEHLDERRRGPCRRQVHADTTGVGASVDSGTATSTPSSAFSWASAAEMTARRARASASLRCDSCCACCIVVVHDSDNSASLAEISSRRSRWMIAGWRRARCPLRSARRRGTDERALEHVAAARPLFACASPGPVRAERSTHRQQDGIHRQEGGAGGGQELRDVDNMLSPALAPRKPVMRP